MDVSEIIVSNEASIRLGCFAAVLIVMLLWELVAPRRNLRVSKSQRWVSNFGVMVLNTVMVRLLFPAAAVGALLPVGHVAFVHRRPDVVSGTNDLGRPRREFPNQFRLPGNPRQDAENPRVVLVHEQPGMSERVFVIPFRRRCGSSCRSVRLTWITAGEATAEHCATQQQFAA